MSTSESSAYRHDARWDAFEPVREAIEEAMDVPGLSPEGRADLAAMHHVAASWCGARSIVIPLELTPGDTRPPTWAEMQASTSYQASERSRAPGGLEELFPHGWPGRLLPALRGLLAAGVGTIDELLDLMGDEDRVLAIRGIGPTRRVALLHALHDHVTANRQEAR